MRHHALLRLLLAAFFLYFAWPYIPTATTQLEKLFWGIWLGLFLLVAGSNFATLLQLTSSPKIEQARARVRQTHKH